MTVLGTYGSGIDMCVEISDRSAREVDARAAEREAIAKENPVTLGGMLFTGYLEFALSEVG